MSVCGVVEVAVHFESFRNIDLFHQGLYLLRARLRRETDGRLAAAWGAVTHPSQQASAEHSKNARPDAHCLFPSQVAEDRGEFSSRCFLIRYCEEEVELNEIAQFRFELNSAEPASSIGALLLEVELVFADLAQHGGADRFAEQLDTSSVEFKTACTQVLRVTGAQDGLHEFVPVVFDEHHFCTVGLAVHSALLDFRFRLPRPPGSAPGDASSPPASGPRAPEAKEASGAHGRQGEPRPRPSSSALSLEEHLFACIEGAGREPLLHRTEAFCQHHIELLAASRSRVVSWAEETIATCLAPVLRELLAPELLLPREARQSASAAGSVGSMSTTCSEGSASGTPAFVRKRLEAAAGTSGAGGEALQRALAAQAALELAAAGCRVAEVWHELLAVLVHAPGEISASLRSGWERDFAARWSRCIVREPLRTDVHVVDEDDCEEHGVAASALREALLLEEAGGRPPSVEDRSLVPAAGLRPVVFEQCYFAGAAAVRRPLVHGGVHGVPSTPPEAKGTLPSDPKPYRGLHLFVLVHGFQGNSFDMRLMRNNLALAYPDAAFLSSTSNEDDTDGDISEMGVRLAAEVRSYIAEWCPGSALGRLSFVAHSLGGLIARSAVALLEEFQGQMYTFLSFSTAHLGIFQDKISLFNTGFWVLKALKQSVFLQQISMADHADPRQTFLYKLSQSRCFEFFQNVALMSCWEDQYGPFRSARAEFCDEWADRADRRAIREMVDNLWGPVSPERVSRLDVSFVLPDGNLDSIIGRAAHIQFLDCQPVMRMLVHNFSHFFR